MELIRLLVAAVAGVLVVGGYLASLSAYFGGTAPNYVSQLDKSSVPMLALGLLLATVVLSFIPAPEVPTEKDEAEV
jgi:amino acid permease